MGIRTAVEGALTAARQGGAEREGRRSRHWLGVGALTVLAAAGYTVFALLLNYTFQTSSYDLVIFDQAVRSYAHFQPGISIIKGVHNGFGPHFSVLGDHWSPILAALAPLYWIYNGPQALLVAQAVLFALAIPPIWVFTRRAFGGDSKATAAAYLVAAAYALSWPIASALDFDFHEVAFAPVLIAVALERLQAGKLRSALIALAILLLVKEDMGLLVAGIGLYLAVARPRTVTRQRLVGGILIVGGRGRQRNRDLILIRPSAGVPTTTGHIPRSGTTSRRPSGTCSPTRLARGPARHTPGQARHDAVAVRRVLLPPAAVADRAGHDPAAARAHAREPVSRTGGSRLISTTPTSWSFWPAPRSTAPRGSTVPGRPAAPVAEGPRGTGAVGLGCAAAMCAVAVVLVPHFAFGAALRPSFYHRMRKGNAAAAADAVVPAGVTVQAVDNLGPQLSGRDTVLLWDGDGSTPPLGSPWVVANAAGGSSRSVASREQERRLALLERNGY